MEETGGNKLDTVEQWFLVQEVANYPLHGLVK
jgi:hypothetical protein